ncbi:leucine/isoleucine/valine transporter subunit; membrane component of ABC superfamily [Candidatus Zixiibacteriota bacterium]|nr:leucine/isoleucine/valine transporter subunit; membrane component of ABC superfamily [candidate division Zixibacteria bacterium]
MNELLQQVINGVSLGSIYALIALGYTMIYGILRFINFAHGDVFMVGAFVGFYTAPIFTKIFGGSTFVNGLMVMAAAMIICAVLGVTIEKFAYKPLRNRPKLTVLITAIGMSLFLEFGGQLVFGPDPKLFPALMPSTAIVNTETLVISTNSLIVIVTAFILMILLRTIVYKTKIGTAMRAVSYNHYAASLMGININTVISFVFAIGSSLAGAAAVLYSSVYPSINPLMGIFPGLKAFIAAVLGGIGNLYGAAIGGLIIGLVETLVTGYISSTYRDAISFSILILILLVKPSGIMGKYETEKV